MASPSNERSSPYVGLSPYGGADADVFFGRAGERDLVVANLLTSRVTVLYGPSGSGKSSLLRAGVVPRLRDGEGLPAGGSRRVIALADTWHEDPVTTILGAVAAAAGEAAEPGSGETPLDETLAGYGERLGAIVLLVLDQFEEYFLYHRDHRLGTELPLALARSDSRVRVLISMREDALADLDRIEGPGWPLLGNLVRLGRMPDAAAREAIATPAERAGMELEPGLSDRVLALLHERAPLAGAARGVRDGGDDGVEPAYIQLVMRRLWDRETRDGSRVLRVASLEAMGSLREMLAAHLAEALAALNPAERRSMADAVRYLVTPSGAKIVQRREDLAKLTGVAEDEIAEPLRKLAAAEARILRPVDDAPSYELFHDVLARPLLDWQEREPSARLQRRAAALGMLGAAAAAIVIVLVGYILAPAWLEKGELMTVDARFAVRGHVAPDSDIVIVDLDDASLAALGGGAPLIPRDVHARMIDALRAAGPMVIAYDFEFRGRAPGNAALRAAIERAGRQLVLAATLIDSEGQGEVLGGQGRELSASVGYAGFPIAADGAYRQVDESVGLSGAERAEPVTRRLVSFAVVAAAAAGDPPPPFERAWIDYHGPARTYPSLRFADVLRGSGARRLQGKVVVVGSSARAQRDLHATAHGGGREMAGAEIQANAISTLRRGEPLKASGTAAELALIVLLGALPAIALIALPPRRALPLLGLAAVAYLAAAALLFSAGWIVPLVYPLLCLLLATAGVVATRLRWPTPHA